MSWGSRNGLHRNPRGPGLHSRSSWLTVATRQIPPAEWPPAAVVAWRLHPVQFIRQLASSEPTAFLWWIIPGPQKRGQSICTRSLDWTCPLTQSSHFSLTQDAHYEAGTAPGTESSSGDEPRKTLSHSSYIFNPKENNQEYTPKLVIENYYNGKIPETI